MFPLIFTRTECVTHDYYFSLLSTIILSSFISSLLWVLFFTRHQHSFPYFWLSLTDGYNRSGKQNTGCRRRDYQHNIANIHGSIFYRRTPELLRGWGGLRENLMKFYLGISSNNLIFNQLDKHRHKYVYTWVVSYKVWKTKSRQSFAFIFFKCDF